MQGEVRGIELDERLTTETTHISFNEKMKLTDYIRIPKSRWGIVEGLNR